MISDSWQCGQERYDLKGTDHNSEKLSSNSSNWKCVPAPLENNKVAKGVLSMTTLSSLTIISSHSQPLRSVKEEKKLSSMQEMIDNERVKGNQGLKIYYQRDMLLFITSSFLKSLWNLQHLPILSNIPKMLKDSVFT